MPEAFEGGWGHEPYLKNWIGQRGLAFRASLGFLILGSHCKKRLYIGFLSLWDPKPYTLNSGTVI